MPNTELPVPALMPVADWSRVRILLDGEPLLAREGEVLIGTRKLDMRRGLLLSAWTHRTPAGITVTGRELRLLSLADRAAGLQLLRLSLDRDGVDVRLEASFAMAGSFRVCWRGRSVAIRIAGRTVEATLVEGEPMEMRIAAATRKLTAGVTLQVSL